jgi:hypothetical protein
VVRMFRFLLGPEGFHRGVQAFFNDNDGKVRGEGGSPCHTAAACAPFVLAVQALLLGTVPKLCGQQLEYWGHSSGLC